MAEGRYKVPRSPVKSLDDGVVLNYVINANRNRYPHEPPPPYSPETLSSVQVAPMTVTPPTTTRHSHSQSRKKWCGVVIGIIILFAVIGFVVWHQFFRVSKEPPRTLKGDIEEPTFYADISSLRSKINLNLKFPSGILSELDGKQKVAVAFLRREFRSGNGLFQVAMLPFGNTVANLSTLVASSAPFMLKTTTGVNFYFEKYPVTLYMEVALGAYDQKKFILAASANATFIFKSKADGQKPLSLEMGKPNKAAEAVVKKIVQQAGWSGVEFSKSKSKEKIYAEATPGCNANYYLSDCSRYCLPKNSFEGHYTCTTDGRKKCLDGWLNPRNNCLDIDYCASTNCLNDGTCQNTNGTAVCTCRTGFTGKFCGSDINECLHGTRCFNGGMCQNTNGSFKCVCPSNVQGKDCSIDVDECLRSGLCQNGGTCTNIHASYKCKCAKNFRGTHCETKAASTVMPSMALSLCVIVALLFR